MSEENIEVVRNLHDRFGTDEWRERIAEDVVWDTSRGSFPEARLHEGHGEVEQFFRSWLGAFESPSLELVEIAAAGDSVFTNFRWRARGRSSGVAVEADFFGVYWLRNGVVVRFVAYKTRAAALEAAGLSE